MTAAGLDAVQALYLVWNEDVSGALSPQPSDVQSLALTLRKDFAAVEATFARKADPDGSIAQALMALVYGASNAAFFFSLLSGTYQVSVSFANASPVPAANRARRVRRPARLRRSEQAAHRHGLSRRDIAGGDQSGARGEYAGLDRQRQPRGRASR